MGKVLRGKWSLISKENKINIHIQGLDALPNFIFDSENHNAYKTFIAQEMIKNILASNTIYTSIDHNENILDDYNILNEIFLR